MSANYKIENDIVVIEIDGKIDNKTAPEIQPEILKQTKKAKKVLIDLSKVVFLSSAGLRILLLVYRQVKANDGKIALAGVMEEIRESLKVTGFVNFFIIVENMNDAYDALK